MWVSLMNSGCRVDDDDCGTCVEEDGKMRLASNIHPILSPTIDCGSLPLVWLLLLLLVLVGLFTVF